MSIRDKYHPNYKKLYPDSCISPEVLKVLKQSDRKMKYIEVDLKQEKFRQSPNTESVSFQPSREDSLERIMEESSKYWAGASAEEVVIQKAEKSELYEAVLQLVSEDREIIVGIYYDGLSERQLSLKTGVPQTTINYRKKRALASLRKILTKNE